VTDGRRAGQSSDEATPLAPELDMTHHNQIPSRSLGRALLALLVLPCLGADECHDVEGVKVYLSPAHHGGTNIGCAGFDEDAGARAIAGHAATTLKSRGFVVNVAQGDYKQNYADSNAWGADLHVPIHSNAGTWGCEESSPASRGGTWTMYRTVGSHGQQLAAQILAAVKGESPGTNDTTVQRTDLLELKASARTAYAEMGFHTYYWDTVWLAFGAKEAGEALAKGIHDHCLVVECHGGAALEIEDGVVISERSAGASADHFDLLEGEPRRELADRLRPWLAALHPDLGASLTSVSEVDGTVVIDFEDIRGLGSGHAFHTSGIAEKVFELGDVDELVFQIEGEGQPFCDWVESDCGVLLRPQPE
jgi:N-acetylmuramoyl-L-alanine amidase